MTIGYDPYIFSFKYLKFVTEKGFEIEFGETTGRTDITDIKILDSLVGIRSELIVNPATKEEALD